MMGNVREFATGWGNYPRTWFDRIEEDLVGTAKGHLSIPLFRPFDFLTAPNKSLIYLESNSSRVAVDANRGAEDYFHRNCDFDQVFFQWAGETIYETEFGRCSAKPADLMLIPAGIAYHATGSADSLRLSIATNEPLDTLIGEDAHVGMTQYSVRWNGAPAWPVPQGRSSLGKGRVLERLHTWRDKPDDTTLIERDYGRLVGVASEGRPIHKIRLFDIFTEITGRKGPGPVPMQNAGLIFECYNTDGDQRGFHRGNRNEEFQFQFMGSANNLCEFGADEMQSGDLFIVRRGIAHRVADCRNFRRLVLYSKEPWQLMIDPAKPVRRTTFEVEETVIEAASWRDDLRTAQTVG
jgi:hypothetical protein